MGQLDGRVVSWCRKYPEETKHPQFGWLRQGKTFNNMSAYYISCFGTLISLISGHVSLTRKVNASLRATWAVGVLRICEWVMGTTVHTPGDSGIPPTRPLPMTLSKVLFQGGNKVEVLPVKKEERKTPGRDTQKEKEHHEIGLKNWGGMEVLGPGGQGAKSGRGLSPFGFVLCRK